MVSFINGIEPRDQVESTLAAQMATVHLAMMKSMQDLALTKNLLEQDAAERGINKFARTFTAQVEALKRYRSTGEQKVTVQHVSVSQGGQAIVGNVTQNPRETAPDKASPSTPDVADMKVAPMKPWMRPHIRQLQRGASRQSDRRSFTQHRSDLGQSALRSQNPERRLLQVAGRTR